MKSSYAQHSADTLEYQQGRNSAEWNLTNPYGLPINNPYESGGKQWLDWLVGYELWVVEKSAPPVEEDYAPVYTPLYDPFWSDRMMAIL